MLDPKRKLTESENCAIVRNVDRILRLEFEEESEQDNGSQFSSERWRSHLFRLERCPEGIGDHG